MSENIFKTVADAFALIHAGGEPYSWTKDPKAAVDWLKGNPKYSVQEFVSLEKYQSAISNDLAALQQKLDDVLAENVVMLQAIEAHKHGFVVCESCGEENISYNDDVCNSLQSACETEKTINNIIADKVEELISSLEESGAFTINDAFTVMENFAAQLRSGKNGE